MLSRKALLGCAAAGLAALGVWSVAQAQVQVCCEPWDNGRWDRRTSQTSQIAFGEDWRLVGRVTADDFSLCEGNVYRIDRVSGVLLTDSIVPKADIIILDDCDGLPNNIVAAAFSVPPSDIPDSLACLVGEVSIQDPAGDGPDGLRQIRVTASWDHLYLKGGQYWVVIYGYSGSADPDEQFFWGTSNNQIVRGRPGQFAEIDDLHHIYWTSIDDICCGCTDFNFCVEGEKCKILLDNGTPDYARLDLVGGYPSLENNNTASRVRAADNFVVPPCRDRFLCYIEAWVWSNCDTTKLSLFADGCHCPTEGGPLATFNSSCVFDTEIGVGTGSTRVTLKKVVFDDFGPGGYRLEANRNYWLSAFAVGDGRQAARGYFCWNSYCDRQCWINFDPACTKGAPYDSSHWVSTGRQLAVNGGRDLAFVVAVHDAVEATSPGGGTTPPSTCRADINSDGAATLQDMFDFLAAWFTGCP